jgi:hypothetical protein
MAASKRKKEKSGAGLAIKLVFLGEAVANLFLFGFRFMGFGLLTFSISKTQSKPKKRFLPDK